MNFNISTQVQTSITPEQFYNSGPWFNAMEAFRFMEEIHGDYSEALASGKIATSQIVAKEVVPTLSVDKVVNEKATEAVAKVATCIKAGINKYSKGRTFKGAPYEVFENMSDMIVDSEQVGINNPHEYKNAIKLVAIFLQRELG